MKDDPVGFGASLEAGHPFGGTQHKDMSAAVPDVPVHKVTQQVAHRKSHAIEGLTLVKFPTQWGSLSFGTHIINLWTLYSGCGQVAHIIGTLAFIL